MPSTGTRRRANSSSSRRCKVAGCQELHAYETVGGARRYSSYCQGHTCRAPRNENTPWCINPRDPANRYCAFHGKCRASRCTMQATLADKEPFPYICPHHRCIVTPCTRMRFGNFQVCDAHITCQIRGCPHHPQLSRNSLLCRDHSCEMVPNCNRPAVQPGIGHCDAHAPCGMMRGCRRQRIRFPDGRQAIHCDLHIPCAMSGQGCRHLAASRSGFCVEHKCSLEGCLDEKKGGSYYCEIHTCSKPSCYQAKFDLYNQHAKYCSSHECAVDRCHHKSELVGGHCATHACSHGSCNNIRSGSSQFCREHCCRHEGCTHEAKHKNGFCGSHACIEAGCKEPRLGGRGHIHQCLVHWTKAVRKSAASEFGHDYNRRREALEEQIRDLQWKDHLREERDREVLLQQVEEERMAEEARLLRIAEQKRALKEQQRKQAEEERIKAEVEQRLAEEEERREIERLRCKERNRKEAEEIKRSQERDARIAREAVIKDRVRKAEEEKRKREEDGDRRQAAALDRLRIRREMEEEEERLRRERDGGHWQHVHAPRRGGKCGHFPW